MQITKEALLKRFTTYAQIETTSDENSLTQPSAACEWDLAHYLVEELQSLQFSDVILTQYGYVLATVPASKGCENEPIIGLIAHMDTSNEASGKNVKVVLHKNYDGDVLHLGDNTEINPKDFPEILRYIGQDIVTSDGTTLLGADDKAGITAIVSACEYLLQRDEIQHGTIRIAFTPDEEIGRGTEHFPLEQFGADFAYTIDGGELGELNYETFNACGATIEFNGISVHPGNAKNKMRNPITIAADWQMSLPAGERPEYTEGYEGFYHTLSIEGGIERVVMKMILRDHDKTILEKRKAYLLALAGFMNEKYGKGSVVCTLKDSYSNMREFITPVFEIVERAQHAMEAVGVTPKLIPVRGGTDGAMLSAQGLPCPNIFTGGHNFHGKLEYLPLDSLLKATQVIVALCKTK